MDASSHRIAVIATVFLVVLAPIAMVENASAISKDYNDGPAYSDEWSDSSYSGDLADTDYNGSTKDIELQYNDPVTTSQSDEGGFTSYDSKDADIGASLDQVELLDGPSSGSGGTLTGAALSHDNPLVGSAASDSNSYYLEGDNEISSTGGSPSSEEATQCNLDIQTLSYTPEGLSDASGYSGYDVTIEMYEGSGGRIDIVGVDFSDCSYSTVASVDTGIGDTPEGMGKAPAGYPDEDRVIAHPDNQQILGLDASSSSLYSLFTIPDYGNIKTLQTFNWPDGNSWYIIGYPDGDVAVFDDNGNTIFGPTNMGDGTAQAAVMNNFGGGEHRYGVYSAAENGNMYNKVPVNLWEGDRAGSVVYSGELSGESGITSEGMDSVTWSGSAPAAVHGSGGSLELQFKDDSGSWITLDSASSGVGSFSNSVSLGGGFDSRDTYEYRVVVNDYGARGSASSPYVTGVSWTYDWYSTPGTVTSTKLNTRDVKEFYNVSIDGSSGGQGVDVRILDRNKTQVFEQQDVQPPGTVDLSSVPVDYSTEYVYVQMQLETNGGSTPAVSGWNLNYEGNPPAEVIEYHVNVTTENKTIYNQSEVTSDIGSTDEFVIDETDQSIEDITWRVNGQNIESQSVSGTGPFDFTYTWDLDQTGSNSVTAKLSNRNGTSTHTWTVSVPSPQSQKLGTVDVIKSETSASNLERRYNNVTVDFPGDSQNISSERGTAFDLVVRTSNENVTYDVQMNTTGEWVNNKTFTNLQGTNVTSAVVTKPGFERKNFDGDWSLSIKFQNINYPNGGTSSFDARGTFAQQILDPYSTPEFASVDVPSGAHVKENVTIEADVSSEVSSIRDVWLNVTKPDGTDIQLLNDDQNDYINSPENRDVSIGKNVSFSETGNYRVNVVAENYQDIVGESRTYVVSVTNSPPQSDIITPPTNINLNRSFTVDWDVTDPENDDVVETGLILAEPDGGTTRFTAGSGSGSHSFTIGPENVTTQGLWSVQAYAIDENGEEGTSSRVFLDASSLEVYQISNVTVESWNGTETTTLHAGREARFKAEILPNVSSTLNGTTYVNLQTPGGSLVSDLYTATSVTLENGTQTNLTQINNGSVVSSRLPSSAEGTYVVEIGVNSKNGESQYQIPVDVKGVTDGEIEEVSISKPEVAPPSTITTDATIRNVGELETPYEFVVRVRQNGTTYVEKTTTTTNISGGNAGLTGTGVEIPKTLAPGEYTVDYTIQHPTYNLWEPFDKASTQFTVLESMRSDIDRLHFTHEPGTIQGYVTLENGGNIDLPEGELTIAVRDAASEQRMRVEKLDVEGIPVGESERLPVNFNFSSERNTTYRIGLTYETGQRTSFAVTQIATPPKPSMEIVDIDGPDKLIQGQNGKWEITMRNNGEVVVDSAAITTELQTSGGNVITRKGEVVESVHPGSTATINVEFAMDDASLLGQSAVAAYGQVSDGENSTSMLSRSDDVFVSAPGFIISGDSAYSDLSVNSQFTVQETFLTVGRPGAAIDVDVEYDESKVKLVSGEENATVTSGGSLSWTFIVLQPMDGQPIQVVATSDDRSQTKQISVSTAGTAGFVGEFDDIMPENVQDAFSNQWVSAVIPGYPWGVTFAMQSGIAIAVFVILYQFWMVLPVVEWFEADFLNQAVILGVPTLTIMGLELPLVIGAAVIGGIGVAVNHLYVNPEGVP